MQNLKEQEKQKNIPWKKRNQVHEVRECEWWRLSLKGMYDIPSLSYQNI